jgi:MoaA/NifB/PqqE/SkfB family radical SAM enzyme
MCDIWKNPDAAEIGARDLERHLVSLEGMGVEWVVFSGGEPLMHSDLFRLCALLRKRRIRITILSTGLLLERNASAIVANADDVIVSLDGPRDVHDRIRRVNGAFDKLTAGVYSIRARRADFPIHARCTVQRLNHVALRETVSVARRMGITGISFLAADVTSTAFNRLAVWDDARQAEVALNRTEVLALESEIDALAMESEGRKFVAESPEKLRRIVRHFRAHMGEVQPVAPRCNAPWVSMVMEADGTVRPCFFHPPVGKVDASTTLGDILNNEEAVRFRSSLDVASNPICQRCVCSLNRTAA